MTTTHPQIFWRGHTSTKVGLQTTTFQKPVITAQFKSLGSHTLPQLFAMRGQPHPCDASWFLSKLELRIQRSLFGESFEVSWNSSQICGRVGLSLQMKQVLSETSEFTSISPWCNIQLISWSGLLWASEIFFVVFGWWVTNNQWDILECVAMVETADILESTGQSRHAEYFSQNPDLPRLRAAVLHQQFRSHFNLQETGFHPMIRHRVFRFHNQRSKIGSFPCHFGLLAVSLLTHLMLTTVVVISHSCPVKLSTLSKLFVLHWICLETCPTRIDIWERRYQCCGHVKAKHHCGSETCVLSRFARICVETPLPHLTPPWIFVFQNAIKEWSRLLSFAWGNIYFLFVFIVAGVPGRRASSHQVFLFESFGGTLKSTLLNMLTSLRNWPAVWFHVHEAYDGCGHALVRMATWWRCETVGASPRHVCHLVVPNFLKQSSRVDEKNSNWPRCRRTIGIFFRLKRAEKESKSREDSLSQWRWVRKTLERRWGSAPGVLRTPERKDLVLGEVLYQWQNDTARGSSYFINTLFKYLTKANTICIEMKYPSIYGFEMSSCHVVPFDAADVNTTLQTLCGSCEWVCSWAPGAPRRSFIQLKLSTWHTGNEPGTDFDFKLDWILLVTFWVNHYSKANHVEKGESRFWSSFVKLAWRLCFQTQTLCGPNVRGVDHFCHNWQQKATSVLFDKLFQVVEVLKLTKFEGRLCRLVSVSDHFAGWMYSITAAHVCATNK